jgi:hypothetical protein
MLAHSADIDPSNLEARNQVKVTFEMGIKPTGRMKTRAVESFDIGLAADGAVKPFDVETRALDPEVALEVGSPHGTVTGLKVFEAIQSVKALEQYTGELAFLKDEVTWKDAKADLWYKAGTAKISSGRITTDDYSLDFSGSTNLDTKALDLDLGCALGEEATEALRSSIEKNLEKQLKGDVGKYVSAEALADIAMKHLTNEDGKVYLRYEVTGTTTSPKAKLVEPSVPPVRALFKEVGGDLADIAKDAARREGQKAIDDAAKQLKDQLNKSLGLDPAY